MATAEERMRILKMVEQKQISAADGAKLLAALQPGGNENAPQPARARWLRVKVTDRSSGRNKVNVTIPIGLLDVGVKMGARLPAEMGGMDLNAIQAAIKGGLQGKIVEGDDFEDDEHVEVYLE
jgi:hypothetical protein